MAIQTISIGNMEDFHQFDDTSTYSDATVISGIRISRAPTNNNDVIRKTDLLSSSVNPLIDIQFLVLALSGNLTNERRLVIDETNGLTKTDGGANADFTINLSQGLKTTSSPEFVTLNLTGQLNVDGTKVVGNQEAAITSLTDSTGGTANNTVQALTDPADAPLLADNLRDDLVANLIPELRNNFADLTAKVNSIITVLRNHGLIAT